MLFSFKEALKDRKKNLLSSFTYLKMLIINTTGRLIENAADELGRLDATCALAPESVALALGLALTAGLAEDTRSTLRALVAADADPAHDALLSPHVLAWRALLESEEKRVRGGARLRLERFGPLAADPGGRLDEIWREPGAGRAILEQAVESAAWSPDLGIAEASAALLLCAGGRTDRLRILPFVDVPASARAAAIERYRDGEVAEWTELALRALATRARAVRMAVLALIAAQGTELERLRPLGRAAITARGSLELLRRRLATTIPALAEELGVSRPAAGDALERLLTLGLASEVTGRARDRVFAYAPACAIGEATLPADAPPAAP